MTPSLRHAVAADAPEVAALFRRSRALLSFLPELHTAEEDLWFVREILIGAQTVTLASDESGLLGFMAEEPGWITQLYLDPAARGRGIGRILVEAAMLATDRLDLWCFAENLPARAFYERLGFVAVETTDGSRNEARCPDIRYRWTRRS